MKYWLRSQDCEVVLSKDRLTRPLSCHLVIFLSSVKGNIRPPPLSPLQGPSPGQYKRLSVIQRQSIAKNTMVWVILCSSSVRTLDEVELYCDKWIRTQDPSSAFACPTGVNLSETIQKIQNFKPHHSDLLQILLAASKDKHDNLYFYFIKIVLICSRIIKILPDLQFFNVQRWKVLFSKKLVKSLFNVSTRNCQFLLEI